MKIAQIAPLAERIPPKSYGGTERVVYALTEELVKMGHDVTLFATGDSTTSAKLISVYPKGLREAKEKNRYGRNEWSLLNFGVAYGMQSEFDIIHDHNILISLPTANVADTPVINTLHDPDHYSRENLTLYQTLNRVNLVAISKSQIEITPHLDFAGMVYNGLDMSDYPFSSTHQGYLLFVGRIAEMKGVHHAIEVAETLNIPLVIAARLETAFLEDIEYFYEKIEPRLSDQIIWIGEVNDRQRNRLMSKALCTLHPARREPFGLTIIEALANGCPVIASNEGSIPELIKNGKVGYVVNDVKEMCLAVKKVGKISRRDCRKHAVDNFSATKMAREYEGIYRRIIHSQKESYIRELEPLVYYTHRINIKK